MLQNPILRGFNPDPNIVRVDDDDYIATSTYEWFGGVQIHHSTDLVNWRVIGQALNNTEQLDMRGVPYSCSVWAPQQHTIWRHSNTAAADNTPVYIFHTVSLLS